MKIKIIGILAITVALVGCGSSEYKKAVKARLRDPESANFRSVEKTNSCVHGVVASRNGFGGMANTYFIYNEKTKYVMLEENQLVYTAMLGGVCRE